MATDAENFAELEDLRRLDELEQQKSVYEEKQEIEGILAEEGGAWEQGGRGIVQGLKGTGRSAANLLLPESLEPEWATKEAIERQNRIDEGSLHGWGTAGKFGGEMLATAPLGAVGWGARGLRAATMAGKYLPKAAKTARALTHPATVGAVEGAGAGALMGGPDNRVQGALTGAAAGGALTGLARTVGRAIPGQVGGRGLVPISETAKKAEQAMGPGYKLPLSIASAGEKGPAAGLAGATYRQVLPMFPLARQTLEKGTGKATAKMNEAMLRKAYGVSDLPGKAGKLADEVLEIAEKQGFRRAVIHGNNALAKLSPKQRTPYQNYNRMRDALTSVSSASGRKGFSPAQVAKEMRKHSPERTPPGLDELEGMEQLLGSAGVESTAFGRRAFYGAGNETDNLFSKLLGATEVVGGGILTKSIASKWFQNALRKDPVLREQVTKVIGKPTAAGIREVIAAARRVASGEFAKPAGEEDAP